MDRSARAEPPPSWRQQVDSAPMLSGAGSRTFVTAWLRASLARRYDAVLEEEVPSSLVDLADFPL